MYAALRVIVVLSLCWVSCSQFVPPNQASLRKCEAMLLDMGWTEYSRVPGSVELIVRLEELLEVLHRRQVPELALTRVTVGTCLARLYIQHRDSAVGKDLLVQAQEILQEALAAKPERLDTLFTFAVLLELLADEQRVAGGNELPADNTTLFEESFRLLRAAADLGSGPAHLRLSRRLSAGSEGVLEANAHLGHYHLHEAAKAGVHQAQLEVALLLLQGVVTEDGHGRVVELSSDKRAGDKEGELLRLTRSHFWLREASSGDLPIAWFYLGRMAEQGVGRAPDLGEAERCLVRAAKLGYAAAAHALGLLLYSSKSQRLDEAVSWLREAAAAGHLLGMTDFGHIQLERGAREEGLAMLQQAARAGSPQATHTLATLVYSGREGLTADPTAAIGLWKAAAGAGHAQSKLAYATALEEGVHVPPDIATALSIYHELVDGSPYVAFRLGNIYASVEFLDCEASVSWLERAAGGGYALAHLSLAELSLESSNCPRDDTRAVYWLLKASQNDDTFSKAVSHLHHGEAEDGRPYRQIAYGMLLKQARKGDSDAQLDVGLTLASGCPECRVVQSDTQALKWFRAAAEQGNVLAMYNLMLFLYEGRGCAADQRQAMVWLENAANRGHVSSMRLLAFSYLQGDGVPRDRQVALHWFRLGAEAGDPQSQFETAILLLESGAEAFDTAWGFLIKAANSGNKPAQSAVAQRLHEGDGCKRDEAQALYWHLMLAHQGNLESKFYAGMLLLNGFSPRQPVEAPRLPDTEFDQLPLEEQGFLWMSKAADGGLSEALSVISAIQIQRTANRNHHTALLTDLLLAPHDIDPFAELDAIAAEL